MHTRIMLLLSSSLSHSLSFLMEVNPMSKNDFFITRVEKKAVGRVGVPARGSARDEAGSGAGCAAATGQHTTSLTTSSSSRQFKVLSFLLCEVWWNALLTNASVAWDCSPRDISASSIGPFLMKSTIYVVYTSVIICNTYLTPRAMCTTIFKPWRSLPDMFKHCVLPTGCRKGR